MAAGVGSLVGALSVAGVGVGLAAGGGFTGAVDAGRMVGGFGGAVSVPTAWRTAAINVSAD